MAIDIKKEAEAVIGSDATVLDETIESAYTHAFSAPIEYEGKKYDTLTFDFDKLTGGDSMDVEAELQAQGHPVIMRSVDSQYIVRMCAKACTDKVGYDIFRIMPVKDFARITNRAKRFL